jgi:hypothetical protein
MDRLIAFVFLLVGGLSAPGSAPAFAQSTRYCFCMHETGCPYNAPGCEYVSCGVDIDAIAEERCGPGRHSDVVEFASRPGGRCGAGLFEFTCH